MGCKPGDKDEVSIALVVQVPLYEGRHAVRVGGDASRVLYVDRNQRHLCLSKSEKRCSRVLLYVQGYCGAMLLYCCKTM